MPRPPQLDRDRQSAAGRTRAGTASSPAPVRLQTLLCVAGVLLWGAGPARAQTIRPDFDITNGTVNATVLSGNTLYIGGSFSSVGRVTGAGVPLDATTGTAVSGFPMVVGQVNAVAADGAGGWYIGGLFTTVGGVARSNLAHILADMQMDSVCIQTGLLHDVVEDCGVTLDQIKSGFGDAVAGCVDGVTKLAKIKVYSREDRQAERQILLQ